MFEEDFVRLEAARSLVITIPLLQHSFLTFALRVATRDDTLAESSLTRGDYPTIEEQTRRDSFACGNGPLAIHLGNRLPT
ncbi:hypothetical protein JYU34_005088 [Plutella xylostella]|uniref:Uncharacterized protein n=1 Tax=Plutella xylostella TaxID=51655 RepID=A0ABQ7QVT9_PLUXY|nr:hypothetical protein JYU34_005088 [Plutella xylostella]